MSQFILVLLVCVGSLFSVCGAEFSRDIAPILIAECLTCHSAEKAKGGYRVHNYGAVFIPGKSNDSPIIAGKPEESELFRRLITHDEDDRMPSNDEPLTTNQIVLFRDWIMNGASLDRGETNSSLAIIVPRADHPAPPATYKSALPILAMAFSPDGQKLAISGHHEINFWDLGGKLQSRVTNAPQRIHSIAFHPTQTSLFAVAGGKPGCSGEVSVFQNGAFLTNLAQHSDELLTVAFSGNGELLAAGGSDNTIRVFNITNWSPVITIQQHADWVTAIQFDSTGDRILSASRDRTSRIYDAHTGELQTTYPNHTAALFSAVFLGDDRVASGGREKIIHFWDIKEGKKRNEISGAESDITELIASEKFLFAASADKLIRQYDIADRKLIRAYSGHISPVFSLGFHPESGRLASGSFNGTVKIWNTKDGTLETTFTAAPTVN